MRRSLPGIRGDGNGRRWHAVLHASKLHWRALTDRLACQGNHAGWNAREWIPARASLSRQ